MVFIRNYSPQQVYVRIFIRSIVFWYILEMLCFRCSGWSLHTSFYWCNSTRVWKTAKWHVHLSTTLYRSLVRKMGIYFNFHCTPSLLLTTKSFKMLFHWICLVLKSWPLHTSSIVLSMSFRLSTTGYQIAPSQDGKMNGGWIGASDKNTNNGNLL